MVASFITGDLNKLLASSDFSEASGDVLYNGVVVEGIFDDEDVEVGMGEGPTEIVAQPMFTGSSDDFVGIADNDVLTVRGEDFRISNWKDDGTGMIEVYLRRESQ
jgi:hypothetical protein